MLKPRYSDNMNVFILLLVPKYSMIKLDNIYNYCIIGLVYSVMA